MQKFRVQENPLGSYSHEFININEWGNNLRMSEIQAAIGR